MLAKQIQFNSLWSAICLLNALKGIGKIIRENAFTQNKKNWLKFNPMLTPIDLQVTGLPYILTSLRFE